MKIPRWRTVKLIGSLTILVAVGIGFLVIKAGNEEVGALIMLIGVVAAFIMYIAFAILRTTASAAGLAKNIKNRAAERDNAPSDDNHSK